MKSFVNDEYVFFTDIIYPPTLIIYDSVYPCEKSHKLNSVNAIVFCIKKDLVCIKTEYCPICGEYFIKKDLFDSYQRMHKGLILKLKFFDASLNAETELSMKGLPFRSYSQLMLYGYRVSGDSLSEKERKELLMYIVFYNLVPINKVISQLSDHISRRGKKNPNAKIIWERDLRFIENFKENIKQPEYEYLTTQYNSWRYGISHILRQFYEDIGIKNPRA